MKKTLYSLMLSDEVVREIDLLAHRMGTNRSNLVNQILAERVRVRTPEQQINDIFSALHGLMSPESELVPFFEPNMPTMSLKSCLEYKYRPTVKYDVELYSQPRGDKIGELVVAVRTRSDSLIAAMTGFFSAFVNVERNYLGDGREYALYDNKFVRSIVCRENVTAEALANAISAYVTLFDSLMKSYIGGRITAQGMSAAYYKYISENNIII